MTDKHPIQIALCITDLDAGGAERALVQLVIRLDRTRFSPSVICLSPPGALTETLLAADVPVTCLNARGPGSYLATVPATQTKTTGDSANIPLPRESRGTTCRLVRSGPARRIGHSRGRETA